MDPRVKPEDDRERKIIIMKMKYTIATIASHSALQILKGAKDEGFTTLAIGLRERIDFYKQFPFIDEYLPLKNYTDFYNIQADLIKRNIIIIPHGSFTAYLGDDYDRKLILPHFGYKKVLLWEIDREKQMLWLGKAELRLPPVYKDIKKAEFPVIVKMFGAKGGSGYFLARNIEDFKKKIKDVNQDYIIQQYIIGTPVYLHYFYSPIRRRIEFMGIDKRYESNADGLARIPDYFSGNIEPSFTIIGNLPLVIRESLLPQVYGMGEKVVETSRKLIGQKGLYGPFCLETIVTADQLFYVIEISCRIVAGTNLYIKGSPYSDLIYDESMSTGRRVAREIREAIGEGRLGEILD